ncbi:hypothetical protein [Ostreiculturibacter nitratireducens]|uniref:hypothetical protein n=1 Tax=Ostreiculturibacter nitratireducens TaxID=3075226 RepID=UPI0031B5D28F
MAKLKLQTIQRSAERDPVAERRSKFIDAVQEQRGYLAKALKGEKLTRTIERKAEDGGVTTVERPARAWFFQQGKDWYLQPRYGARVLLLDGKSNAIHAVKAADLDPILEALGKAAEAGELDKVLEAASQRKAKAKAN